MAACAFGSKSTIRQIEPVFLFVVGNMLILFFGYGLAFFFFGLAILFQCPKASEFKVSRYLPFLGMFGVMHGLQEWTDMFLSLGQQYWPSPWMRAFEVLGVYAGTVSYVFLLLFGIQAVEWSTVRFTRAKAAAIWIVPTLIFFLLLKDSSPEALNNLQIGIRYGLAFPASLAAAFAFARYSRSAEITELQNRRIVYSMKGLAAIFAVYAVVAGLVVPPGHFSPASLLNTVRFVQWFAIPVQLVRAFCAVAAAVLVSGMLHIFAVESEVRRQTEIRRRMEVIGEMNHHIRNALQGISLSTFFIGGQNDNVEIINGSVERIDWALKEILPKI